MEGYTIKKDHIVFEILPNALAAFKKKLIGLLFRKPPQIQSVDQRPNYRPGLFTKEQLDKFGCFLSPNRPVEAGSNFNIVIDILSENENIFQQVNVVLREFGNSSVAGPGIHYLVKNLARVEERLKQDKKLFLKPVLKNTGPLLNDRQPEVAAIYEIAGDIVYNYGGQIDLNNLYRFSIAYPHTTFLKIGKAWAFPAMLRLVVIEYLYRLSIKAVLDNHLDERAADWTTQFANIINGSTKEIQVVKAALLQQESLTDIAFLASLGKKIKENRKVPTQVVHWLNQVIIQQGQTMDELLAASNKARKAYHLSMIHHVNSFLFLDSIDWNRFLETTCLEEQVRLRDFKGYSPSGDYFITNDSHTPILEKKINNI